MQVMQPVASEVFKVRLSSLQKISLYFLSLLLATFALSETENILQAVLLSAGHNFAV
jgi:hypothetical protein